MQAEPRTIVVVEVIVVRPSALTTIAAGVGIFLRAYLWTVVIGVLILLGLA
jgi:hypothetical protein